MKPSSEFDAWSEGPSYEAFMGRWSRRIATRFVAWLAPPADATWLEIGCGTGALTSAILAEGAPRSILSTDKSEGFIDYIRSSVEDDRVRFEVADAGKLPASDASVDVVTSALVFNFIPDRPSALAEMRRVLKPDGCLSFYVWDYPGGGIGFINVFWKAAMEIDPRAASLEEGRRFPFCTREGLVTLCREAEFQSVEVEPIEIETSFPDFAAFWQPFTLGTGPAPGYLRSLPEEQRAALKARLADALGTAGPVRLVARAWAVKARRQA